MMNNHGINPIKQNLNMKQYIGWFMALFFPFAVSQISDIIKMPLIVITIYWFICGILLRYLLERRLPYFNMKIRAVKKEIIVLIFLTIICSYLYMQGHIQYNFSNDKVLINSLLFAFLNGCFEQLVWVNIFDLAGARVKLNGFLAGFLYIVLINIFFWNKLMPVPINNIPIFMILQGLLVIVALNIYMRTSDLTLWSIQRIIYNLIVVFLSGLGTNFFT